MDISLILACIAIFLGGVGIGMTIANIIYFVIQQG